MLRKLGRKISGFFSWLFSKLTIKQALALVVIVVLATSSGYTIYRTSQALNTAIIGQQTNSGKAEAEVWAKVFEDSQTLKAHATNALHSSMNTVGRMAGTGFIEGEADMQWYVKTGNLLELNVVDPATLTVVASYPNINGYKYKADSYTARLAADTSLSELNEPDSRPSTVDPNTQLLAGNIRVGKYIVQTCVSADALNTLIEQYKFQVIVDELVKSGSLNYVVVDTLAEDGTYKAVAHSIHERMDGNADNGEYNPNDDDATILKGLFAGGDSIASEYAWDINKEDDIPGISTIDTYVPVHGADGKVAYVLNIGVKADADFIWAKVKGVQRDLTISSLIAVILGIGVILLTIILVLGRLKPMEHAMKALANGDLTVAIPERKADELTPLFTAASSMTSVWREIVGELLQHSTRLSHTAEELSSLSAQASQNGDDINAASEEVAKGATETAMSIEHAGTELAKLVSDIHKTGESMQVLEEAVTSLVTLNEENIQNLMRVRDVSVENKSLTSDSKEAVTALHAKTADIKTIIAKVESIAGQTNLLALNASIEAARAGEHGRGFAVVAEEIRKLAEESRKATEEISGIIQAITKDTDVVTAKINAVSIYADEQARDVDDAVKKAESTVKVFDDVSAVVESFAVLNQAVVKTSDTVRLTLDGIAAISEENAAAAEEVTATANSQHSLMIQVAGDAKELTQVAREQATAAAKFTV